MSAWLRKVYVRRPDGFFHMSKSLLIYDSMRVHLTDSVKAQVKKNESGACHHSGWINERTAASRYFY